MESKLEEAEFKLKMKGLDAHRQFDNKKSKIIYIYIYIAKWVLKIMNLKLEKANLRMALSELQEWITHFIYKSYKITKLLTQNLIENETELLGKTKEIYENLVNLNKKKNLSISNPRSRIPQESYQGISIPDTFISNNMNTKSMETIPPPPVPPVSILGGESMFNYTKSELGVSVGEYPNSSLPPNSLISDYSPFNQMIIPNNTTNITNTTIPMPSVIHPQQLRYNYIEIRKLINLIEEKLINHHTQFLDLLKMKIITNINKDFISKRNKIPLNISTTDTLFALRNYIYSNIPDNIRIKYNINNDENNIHKINLNSNLEADLGSKNEDYNLIKNERKLEDLVKLQQEITMSVTERESFVYALMNKRDSTTRKSSEVKLQDLLNISVRSDGKISPPSISKYILYIYIYI